LFDCQDPIILLELSQGCVQFWLLVLDLLHPELLGLIIILFPLVFARLDFSLHTLLYTLLPLAHQLVLLQLQQLPLHLIDGPHMLFIYR
jgi:hypothetical protein